MTKAERTEWIEKLEDAERAAKRARVIADRAVWPEAPQAKADAEAALDAWMALEREAEAL